MTVVPYIRVTTGTQGPGQGALVSVESVANWSVRVATGQEGYSAIFTPQGVFYYKGTPEETFAAIGEAQMQAALEASVRNSELVMRASADGRFAMPADLSSDAPEEPRV